MRLLALDPYDAITMPVYTFDINASEEIDWLTIEGIQKEDATKIIEHRKAHGFFTSLDQMKEVDGLSDEAVDQIISSEFDQEYLEGLTIPDLTFSALLTKPLMVLLFRALAWFVLIFGSVYFFFIRKQKFSNKKLVFTGLRYLSFWILLLLAGLIFVVMGEQAWMFLLVLFVLLAGINLIIYRKNKVKIWRSLYVLSMMSLIILFSIV